MPRAQIQLPPVVLSPSSPLIPALIFTTTLAEVGSKRVTEPSPWLRVQTPPCPTTRCRGTGPTLVVARHCALADRSLPDALRRVGNPAGAITNTSQIRPWAGAVQEAVIQAL